MKANTILLSVAALFFFSCSSGNGSGNEGTAAATQPTATATPAAYDNNLAKGKVTDSVICKNNAGHSYALYLPSYYTAAKKFPCIYFFDSHARGALPVKSYKALAEKYGFILIGSNMSKNGTPWQVTNEGVTILFEDTRSRMNIEPTRVYTSGFSGGSRVASTIAISDGGVAGVIGCAAGFPQVENAFQHKFDYFGMAGNYDFNLTDMEQLDAALAQNGFSHQLITFNGKHEWPPVADFETALLWMQVNAMKENLQPKNDTVANALKQDYKKRIDLAKASGELVREQQLLDGMIRTLGGIADVSASQQLLSALTATEAYKNAVVANNKQQQEELSKQQELASEYATHDETWWAQKIATLNKTSRGKSTAEAAQMNKRLVNFLGLVSYMNANHALNTGDLNNANSYIKIFKLADPGNSDCSYLAAIYWMKKDDKAQAFAALNDAAKLGYSDISQLTSEPAFASLLNDAEFVKIVSLVRANISK